MLFLQENTAITITSVFSAYLLERISVFKIGGASHISVVTLNFEVRVMYLGLGFLGLNSLTDKENGFCSRFRS